VCSVFACRTLHDVCTGCMLQVIRCHVEGSSRPLRLTLSGTCVGVPASRDVYHVTTSVRQRETKALPVPNHTTNVTYNLRPVIDGTEHFSGPETLVVPPSSTRTYELAYQPLTMTTDGKKHTVNSRCHSYFLLFFCMCRHRASSFILTIIGVCHN